MDEIDEILETNVVDKNNADRNVAFREKEIDDLVDNIKYASHINESKRALFLRLAEMYLPDLDVNLFKNQFDLAKKYEDTTADEWTSFLVDNMVSKYVQKHKNIFLKASAENNLADYSAKGKKESLSLIEKIDAENKEESKQNIVILRIPGKEELYEHDIKHDD